MSNNSSKSLLLLFEFNVALLVVVLLLFGLIRRIRGDKKRVYVNVRLAKQYGIEDHDLD